MTVYVLGRLTFTFSLEICGEHISYYIFIIPVGEGCLGLYVTAYVLGKFTFTFFLEYEGHLERS